MGMTTSASLTPVATPIGNPFFSMEVEALEVKAPEVTIGFINSDNGPDPTNGAFHGPCKHTLRGVANRLKNIKNSVNVSIAESDYYKSCRAGLSIMRDNINKASTASKWQPVKNFNKGRHQPGRQDDSYSRGVNITRNQMIAQGTENKKTINQSLLHQCIAYLKKLVHTPSSKVENSSSENPEHCHTDLSKQLDVSTPWRSLTVQQKKRFNSQVEHNRQKLFSNNIGNSEINQNLENIEIFRQCTDYVSFNVKDLGTRLAQLEKVLSDISIRTSHSEFDSIRFEFIRNINNDFGLDLKNEDLTTNANNTLAKPAFEDKLKNAFEKRLYGAAIVTTAFAYADALNHIPSAEELLDPQLFADHYVCEALTGDGFRYFATPAKPNADCISEGQVSWQHYIDYRASQVLKYRVANVVAKDIEGQMSDKKKWNILRTNGYSYNVADDIGGSYGAAANNPFRAWTQFLDVVMSLSEKEFEQLRKGEEKATLLMGPCGAQQAVGKMLGAPIFALEHSSGRMSQLGPHCGDFHEVSFLQKSLVNRTFDKIQPGSAHDAIMQKSIANLTQEEFEKHSQDAFPNNLPSFMLDHSEFNEGEVKVPTLIRPTDCVHTQAILNVKNLDRLMSHNLRLLTQNDKLRATVDSHACLVDGADRTYINGDKTSVQAIADNSNGLAPYDVTDSETTIGREKLIVESLAILEKILDDRPEIVRAVYAQHHDDASWGSTKNAILPAENNPGTSTHGHAEEGSRLAYNPIIVHVQALEAALINDNRRSIEMKVRIRRNADILEIRPIRKNSSQSKSFPHTFQFYETMFGLRKPGGPSKGSFFLTEETKASVKQTINKLLFDDFIESLQTTVLTNNDEVVEKFDKQISKLEEIQKIFQSNDLAEVEFLVRCGFDHYYHENLIFEFKKVFSCENNIVDLLKSEREKVKDWPISVRQSRENSTASVVSNKSTEENNIFLRTLIAVFGCVVDATEEDKIEVLEGSHTESPSTQKNAFQYLDVSLIEGLNNIENKISNSIEADVKNIHSNVLQIPLKNSIPEANRKTLTLENIYKSADSIKKADDKLVAKQEVLKEAWGQLHAESLLSLIEKSTKKILSLNEEGPNVVKGLFEATEANQNKIFNSIVHQLEVKLSYGVINDKEDQIIRAFIKILKSTHLSTIQVANNHDSQLLKDLKLKVENSFSADPSFQLYDQIKDLPDLVKYKAFTDEKNDDSFDTRKFDEFCDEIKKITGEVRLFLNFAIDAGAASENFHQTLGGNERNDKLKEIDGIQFRADPKTASYSQNENTSFSIPRRLPGLVGVGGVIGQAATLTSTVASGAGKFLAGISPVVSGLFGAVLVGVGSEAIHKARISMRKLPEQLLIKKESFENQKITYEELQTVVNRIDSKIAKNVQDKQKLASKVEAFSNDQNNRALETEINDLRAVINEFNSSEAIKTKEILQHHFIRAAADLEKLQTEIKSLLRERNDNWINGYLIGGMYIAAGALTMTGSAIALSGALTVASPAIFGINLAANCLVLAISGISILKNYRDGLYKNETHIVFEEEGFSADGNNKVLNATFVREKNYTKKIINTDYYYDDLTSKWKNKNGQEQEPINEVKNDNAFFLENEGIFQIIKNDKVVKVDYYGHEVELKKDNAGNAIPNTYIRKKSGDAIARVELRKSFMPSLRGRDAQVLVRVTNQMLAHEEAVKHWMGLAAATASIIAVSVAYYSFGAATMGVGSVALAPLTTLPLMIWSAHHIHKLFVDVGPRLAATGSRHNLDGLHVHTNRLLSKTDLTGSKNSSNEAAKLLSGLPAVLNEKTDESGKALNISAKNKALEGAVIQKNMRHGHLPGQFIGSDQRMNSNRKINTLFEGFVNANFTDQKIVEELTKNWENRDQRDTRVLSALIQIMDRSAQISLNSNQIELSHLRAEIIHIDETMNVLSLVDDNEQLKDSLKKDLNKKLALHDRSYERILASQEALQSIRIFKSYIAKYNFELEKAKNSPASQEQINRLEAEFKNRCNQEVMKFMVKTRWITQVLPRAHFKEMINKNDSPFQVEQYGNNHLKTVDVKSIHLPWSEWKAIAGHDAWLNELLNNGKAMQLFFNLVVHTMPQQASYEANKIFESEAQSRRATSYRQIEFNNIKPKADWRYDLAKITDNRTEAMVNWINKPGLATKGWDVTKHQLEGFRDRLDGMKTSELRPTYA
ncbi:MAG: hypothetical protein V4629_01160 [Pseudomonadota bacterium]